MANVAIITGASSGIGLATAELLTREGWHVYGIARHPNEDHGFQCLAADVNELSYIRMVFDQVYEQEGKIDAVINNAGMGIAGAIEHATPENIQRIFDTNLTSLVKISSLAIPYLKETKGHLVNIGSVAGELPIPFQACYSATKAAVLSFSLALDGEVRRFGVKVSVVQPGDTKTGFTDARIFEGDRSDYGGSVGKSVRRMEHDERSGKSPITVAKAVSRILKKRRPPLKVTVGASYKLFVGLRRLLPTRFVNFILRKLYG